MADCIHWGILGTGFIASRFAESVIQSPYGELQSVASRNHQNASQFAANYNIPGCYDDYEELLNDPKVDAVYVATPHPVHHEWATKSLKAGKPTLCEKPLGMNSTEVESLFGTAENEQVFLMEAYMYRCHPQIAKAIEWLRSGAIGDLVSMEAHFCFEAPFDPSARLFNRTLGGGAILDVGGYPASLCRLFAGVATGKPYEEPDSIKASGKVNPDTGTDEYAAALLVFPSGIHASIFCATRFSRPEEAILFGRKGWLKIESPWIPEAGKPTRLLIKQTDKPLQTFEIENPRLVWSYEVDKFAQALGDPDSIFPAMSREDSLGNMRLLESWMEALDCSYNSEN